jgi:hypothetical protein
VGAPRDTGAQERIVFFRDDDVDELTDELIEFVNFFLAEEIPVNYQVVPGKLQDDACEFILEKRRAHPDLFRLNQHGYMHEHVINGVHTWFEYSGNRPYEDQYESIQSGQHILRERFGSYFDDRVFTPPGHKYDENTLRALEALGFEILSASSYTSPQARLYYGFGKLLRRTSLAGKRISYSGQRLPGHRLLEVSIALDVDMAKDQRGNPITKTSPQLIREFQQARRNTRVVGIVLHHSGYTPQKRDALRDFVGFLRSTPGLSFQLIEDVAEGFAASRQL